MESSEEAGKFRVVADRGTLGVLGPLMGQPLQSCFGLRHGGVGMPDGGFPGKLNIDCWVQVSELLSFYPLWESIGGQSGGRWDWG